IWDDHLLIKDNIYIKSFIHLDKIFTQDLGQGVGVKFNFYRPLQLLSYCLEYRLWGLNVTGYHLVNVSLHTGIALLLYLLVYLLSRKKLVSFLSSILFLIHPLATETVCYLSNRADLLATSFMLVSLNLYILWIKGKHIGRGILSLLFFLLALFSKETALIFPLLLVFYNWVFLEKNAFKKTVPFFTLLSLFILFRIFFVSSSLSVFKNIDSFYQRLPGFFSALLSYLRLLFLPINLHMEYGKKLFYWRDFTVVTGILLFIALFYYALLLPKKKPLVAFSLGFFLIGLIPISNIFPLPFYMSEHYIYFSSLGFFMVLGYFLTQGLSYKKYKYLVGTAIAFLSFIFLIMTISQAKYWKEPISFYQRILKFEPNSARIHHNLGDAYQEKGLYDNSIEHYLDSIELDPGNASTYTNLGTVYGFLGKDDLAISFYKKAIDVDPGYALAYNNLGVIYQRKMDFPKAVDLYKKSLELNDHYIKTYINLSIIYIITGDFSKSLAASNKALALNPYSVEAYVNRGVALFNQGKYNKALDSYSKAVEINPDYLRIYYNIGIAYTLLDYDQKAIANFRKATGSPEVAVDAYYNLGVLYRKNGMIKEAINAFLKVAEIAPEADVYNNLAMIYYELGDFEQAKEYFNQAVALGSDNPYLYNLLYPSPEVQK
ncbi:MAG: tetratricopeptide repeat protein, partial [Candidatus Omnitrophica bacterium]|nr:tetratricopeptide repeat protein [Candidatus Omnitrophota bacterium]